MKNVIFTYWHSNSGSMPAYIELCIETWKKIIPNLDIVLINQSNLNNYIGNTYDMEKLKKISLPMQSDIVSAAVLEKFGGFFIDADTLITQNIFEIFNLLPQDKLIGFGVPPNIGFHLAVMYCGKKDNAVLKAWRQEAQKRLENLPKEYDWSFFGNSILSKIFNDPDYKNDFLIIDRIDSGNILEAKIFGGEPKNAVFAYQNLYFNEIIDFDVKKVTSYVKYGLVSLHNSWTPLFIKSLDDKVSVLKYSNLFSKLINYILDIKPIFVDSNNDQPTSAIKLNCNPYVELKSLALKDGLFFPEGIAVFKGVPVADYSHINYFLNFANIDDSSDVKKFLLAKGKKKFLTQELYDGINHIDYSHGWFATKGFLGLDLETLPCGKYILSLELSTELYTAVVNLSYPVNFKNFSYAKGGELISLEVLGKYVYISKQKNH